MYIFVPLAAKEGPEKDWSDDVKYKKQKQKDKLKIQESMIELNTLSARLKKRATFTGSETTTKTSLIIKQ